MEMRELGSKSVYRARSHEGLPWFFHVRSRRSAFLNRSFRPHIPAGIRGSAAKRQPRECDKFGPSSTCQGNSNNHPGACFKHTRQPRFSTTLPTLNGIDDRHCANDQQSPDILLTHLCNASQPFFSSGRMLSRHKAEPCCKITPRSKVVRGWAKGRNCDGRHRAYARHGLHQLRFF